MSKIAQTGLKFVTRDLSATGSSTLTLAVRAGSRAELSPGSSSVLKGFAFSLCQANQKRSSLATIRSAELAGGILNASMGREHLLLTAHFLNGDEDLFLDILLAQIRGAKLYQHEFAENVMPALATQHSQFHADPYAVAVDAFHRVAFRTGLGNSICPDPHAVHLSQQDLRDAYTAAFGSEQNIALLSQGSFNIEAALAASEVVPNSSDDVPRSGAALSAKPAKKVSKFDAPFNQKSVYFGGEERISVPTMCPTFLFGYGVTDSSKFAALQVLSSLLGGVGQVAPYTAGTLPLSKVVPSNSSKGTVKPFVQTYTDAAVFGISIQNLTHAETKEAAINSVKVLKQLATSPCDEELLKGAIARVKLDLSVKMATRDGWTEFAVQSLAASANIPTQTEALAAFDSVNVKSITDLATSLLKLKPTIVGAGHVSQLPHADEIGF